MSAEMALIQQLKPKVGDIRLINTDQSYFTDFSGTWVRNGTLNYSSTDLNPSIKMFPALYNTSSAQYFTRSAKIGTRIVALQSSWIIAFNGTVRSSNVYTPTIPATISVITVKDICGTSSRMVISDSDSTSEIKLSYSNDGITFTNCTMVANTLGYALACKPNGSLWVAAGTNGTSSTGICTSTDGITWTSRTPSGGVGNNSINQAVYFSAADKFVYMVYQTAQNGTIHYSTDGYTLTPVNLSAYSNVQTSNGRFFEANGKLYYTTNGSGYFEISSDMSVVYVPHNQKSVLIGFHNGNFLRADTDGGKITYGTTPLAVDGFFYPYLVGGDKQPYPNVSYGSLYADDNIIMGYLNRYQYITTTYISSVYGCDASTFADMMAGKYFGVLLQTNANGSNTFIKVK